MRINDVLKKRRIEILAIAARYGARNIRLFGSIAKGTATESSDVDLLLEMEAGRSLLDLVAIKQGIGRPAWPAKACCYGAFPYPIPSR